MPQALKAHLREPYPYYLSSDRDNLLLSAGLGVFVFFFFQVFRPFGLDAMYCTPTNCGIFGFIAFAVMSSNLIGVPKLFPTWFRQEDWTVVKFVLFNCWHILAIAFISSLYAHYLMGDPQFGSWIEHFLVDVFRTATVAVIPIVALTFMIRNRLLRQRLDQARLANHRLGLARQLRTERPASTQVSGTMRIQAETQETLEVPAGSLLFAQADDNYSRVIWLEQGDMKEHLLRISLKNLEDQLRDDRYLRVHRSFLVDLEQVSEVRGNASGYRLWMESADKEVPVARSRGKEVLERISVLT